MDKEQRRAHLVLQGQTLLDEWLEFVAKWSNGSWSTTLCPDSGSCWRVSTQLYSNSAKAWHVAVLAELGDAGVIYWTREGCEISNGEISNGEVYLYPA